MQISAGGHHFFVRPGAWVRVTGDAPLPLESLYSQFCERYRRFCAQVDASMRQEHRAGEKAFLDYSKIKSQYLETLRENLYSLNLARNRGALGPRCGSHPTHRFRSGRR